MEFLLWIGILLVGYALGCKNKDGAVVWMSKETEKWVVLSIFMIALIVRFWGFGSIPYGMNQDEAMAAVDAKALADYATDRFGMHLPVHFTAWGYGQMSVLLSYCMVPFIKMLGFQPTSIRLPMLIFSMLGMMAVYQITKLAFGRKTAFFVLLICAANPWHFMQSRWSLDCNLFPHVLALGILFLILGMKKQRYLYLSMFFFALCMYCYGIALYTVPFYLVVMCIYLLRRGVIKWLQALICVAVYLFFAWPFYMTMAINTFKWETIETPLFTIPYFPDSVRSKDILFFSEKPLLQLWYNLKSFCSVFFDTNGLSCNYVEGYAPITLFLLPFAVLGVILFVLQRRAKREKVEKAETDIPQLAQTALLVFLLTGVMAGILTNYVNVNRVNIIFYPVMIFSGLGISFTVKRARKWSLALVPMGLVAVLCFFVAYFGKYTESYKELCYTDFIDAVKYLEETECTSYVITPDSQYYGSYNVSEIMTLYAQAVDARYFQNTYSDEKGLFYRDKFKYARAEEMLPYAQPGTGFVIGLQEAGFFAGTDYNLIYFGRYAVAVP